jgi:DNA-binding Lrp family transcriptional regulator
MEEPDAERSWTFLSHHGHVLISVYRDPTLRMRDIAKAVGITERAAATLISDLVRTGYLRRFKDGRRNRYQVDHSGALRHPINKGSTVSSLLTALTLPIEVSPSDPAATNTTSAQSIPKVG